MLPSLIFLQRPYSNHQGRSHCRTPLHQTQHPPLRLRLTPLRDSPADRSTARTGAPVNALLLVSGRDRQLVHGHGDAKRSFFLAGGRRSQCRGGMGRDHPKCDDDSAVFWPCLVAPLADRYDQRRLLVILHLVASGISAGLFLAVANDWLSIPLLIAYAIAWERSRRLSCPPVTRSSLRSRAPICCVR